MNSYIINLTEEEILRIEKYSIKDTKLICIENVIEDRKAFNNIREFVEYSKNPEFIFNKGDECIVSRYENESIKVTNLSTDVNQYFYIFKGWGNFIFDYFQLKSEYMAIARDKQIDSIIDKKD